MSRPGEQTATERTPGRAGAHPIEVESYRRLRAAVDTGHLPPLTRTVVERMVHASADLDYVGDVVAREADLRAGVDALRAGAPILTDVQMVAAGLTRPAACRVGESATRRRADELGTTRSAAALRLGLEECGPGAVVVVGCAPTALFELVADPSPAPALVIGLPVGFVDAVESKLALRATDLPQLSNRGPKGGSAVAAAACNALVHCAKEDV